MAKYVHLCVFLIYLHSFVENPGTSGVQISRKRRDEVKVRILLSHSFGLFLRVCSSIRHAVWSRFVLTYHAC